MIIRNIIPPMNLRIYESATGNMSAWSVISQTADEDEIIVVMPYDDAPEKSRNFAGDIILQFDGVFYGADVDAAADAMRGASLSSQKETR